MRSQVWRNLVLAAWVGVAACDGDRSLPGVGDGGISEGGTLAGEAGVPLVCPAPPFNYCGGDLTGTWTYAGVCRLDGMNDCAKVAAFDDHHVRLTLTFRPAQGKADVHEDIDVTETEIVDRKCLNEPCSMFNRNSPVITRTCTDQGSTCACQVTSRVTRDFQDQMLTSNPNGNVRVDIAPELAITKPLEAAYCVDGDTLSIFPDDMPDPLEKDDFFLGPVLHFAHVLVMHRVQQSSDMAAPRDAASLDAMIADADLKGVDGGRQHCEQSIDCVHAVGAPVCYLDTHTCGCANESDCEFGFVCHTKTGDCAPGCSQFHPCPGGTAAGCCGTPGMCYNILIDVNNCGACNSPCSKKNGVPSCSNGMCHITCNTGWGDCDGDITNGCEADLTTSDKNCGKCGAACLGATHCHAGACS